MSYSAVCRICLSTDVRMYEITNTHLQLVFEKLTSNPLHTADMRPVSACYICYAQLNKCHKLMLTATKADIMLTDILRRHPQGFTNLAVLIGDRADSLCPPLSTTPVDCCDNTWNFAPIEVKSELECLKNDIQCDLVEESSNSAECDIKNEDSDFDVEDHMPLYRLSTAQRDTVSEIPVKKEIQEGVFNEEIEPETEIKQKADGNRNKEHEISVKGEIQEGPSCNDSKLEKRKVEQAKEDTSNETRTDTAQVGERRLECSVCHKYDDNLKNDSIFTDENPFLCNECTCNKKRNTRTRTGKKLYECNICQNQYSYLSTLIAHLRIHTGNKPYECDTCHKRFVTKYALQSHLKIHISEKYECDTCQKRFKTKEKLQFHMKIHSDRKLYECDDCKKGYKTKRYLIKHIKKHLVCNVCHSVYTNKNSFRHHVKKHQFDKPPLTYECNDCKHKFVGKNNLKWHVCLGANYSPLFS